MKVFVLVSLFTCRLRSIDTDDYGGFNDDDDDNDDDSMTIPKLKL